MASKAIQRVDLMQEADIAIVPAAGYVCERVPIRWYIEKNDVYKQGSKKVDGKWIDLYAPSKTGLSKLLVGGGIKTVECNIARVGNDWIWSGEWKGVYTTPAGIDIPLEGNYEYDVTIGGGRWCEKRSSEIAYMVKKQANNWRLNKEGVARTFKDLPEEMQKDFREMAEEAATAYCEHEAMYGAQRAETGAMLRPIRVLFGIRSNYTEDEVRNTEFVIYRTRMDMAAMQEAIGPLGAQVASFVQVLKNAGVSDAAQITDLTKVFLEAQTQSAQTVEGEIVEEDKGDNSFRYSAKPDTQKKLRGLMAKFHGKSSVSSDGMKKLLDRIFDGPEDGRALYSEGHALLAMHMYEKMLVQKEADISQAELKAMAAQMRDFVLKCAHEKRMWQEGEDLEQPALPLDDEIATEEIDETELEQQ